MVIIDRFQKKVQNDFLPHPFFQPFCRTHQNNHTTPYNLSLKVALEFSRNSYSAKPESAIKALQEFLENSRATFRGKLYGVVCLF